MNKYDDPKLSLETLQTYQGYSLQVFTSGRIKLSFHISEAFEERVAIHINEGGIPTQIAMDLAAQAQGFRNQAHYWAWLRVYLERKRLG